MNTNLGNKEIRSLVDEAINAYKAQPRSYGMASPSRFLEEEIFSSTGEWKKVRSVERPTVKEMMGAAKAALRN